MTHTWRRVIGQRRWRTGAEGSDERRRSDRWRGYQMREEGTGNTVLTSVAARHRQMASGEGYGNVCDSFQGGEVTLAMLR